jgi:acyl-CoA thioesterase-1
MRPFVRLLPVLLLAAASSPAQAPAERPLVVAFGDSLTAGYGLESGLGFAPQLEATLRRHGIAATVEDAGVSGDTSSAARERLAWTLDGLGAKPALVIVELGGNDMLRTLDPALVEANLDAILAELERRNVPVLLAGMRATRNLDPAYVARFEAIYPRLAAKHRVPLYPFFLDGAALVPEMMQDDSIHPTFAGVKTVVTRIAPAVKAALRD